MSFTSTDGHLHVRPGLIAVMLLLTLVGSGCAPAAGPTPMVRVALRADAARTKRPTAYLTPGDTVGLVARRLNGPPTTLIAVPAGGAVAAFRKALDEERLPVTSPIVGISLPSRLPDRTSSSPTEFDVVFFHDRNGNRTWDEGEPFVVSWTGGRGGYRLTYFADPPADLAGAVHGWNLIEGGMPPVYHAGPASTLVYIYPVIEPVERR